MRIRTSWAQERSEMGEKEKRNNYAMSREVQEIAVTLSLLFFPDLHFVRFAAMAVANPRRNTVVTAPLSSEHPDAGTVSRLTAVLSASLPVPRHQGCFPVIATRGNISHHIFLQNLSSKSPSTFSGHAS